MMKNQARKKLFEVWLNKSKSKIEEKNKILKISFSA